MKTPLNPPIADPFDWPKLDTRQLRDVIALAQHRAVIRDFPSGLAIVHYRLAPFLEFCRLEVFQPLPVDGLEARVIATVRPCGRLDYARQVAA